MNRILLDTFAYSAFMRGDPKIKSAIQRADEIYLNITYDLGGTAGTSQMAEAIVEKIGAF